MIGIGGIVVTAADDDERKLLELLFNVVEHKQF
jgi:hypothetical protein